MAVEVQCAECGATWSPPPGTILAGAGWMVCTDCLPPVTGASDASDDEAICDCGHAFAVDPDAVEREGLVCPACNTVLAEAEPGDDEIAG